MLQVTEAAADHLEKLITTAMAEQELDEHKPMVIRFVSDAAGLSLMLDIERAEDITFDHRGKTILVFDRGVSELLADAVLDVKTSEEGTRLVLQ
ncbi:MAG TPA: hypothetical protein EYP56_06435 [Planctomycetaceae bacterium]|nr:hypothetical protein [Planctomycetaceae bacterium]